MQESSTPFDVYPGGLPGPDDAPSQQYQELWFSLSRLPWASIVLVPVDDRTSVAEIANSLANVGTRLRDAPVTAIVAKGIDYKSARALADLQPRLNAPALSHTIDVVGTAVPQEPRVTSPEPPPVVESRPLAPLGRAIIAIRPVLREPLGVAIAQAADAVVLCIELGKTRMADARRTIELIGADRVIGAFVIRPS